MTATRRSSSRGVRLAVLIVFDVLMGDVWYGRLKCDVVTGVDD